MHWRPLVCFHATTRKHLMHSTQAQILAARIGGIAYRPKFLRFVFGLYETQKGPLEEILNPTTLHNIYLYVYIYVAEAFRTYSTNRSYNIV